MFELHSPTLEEHGLHAALETLLDRAFEGAESRTRFRAASTTEPPLPTAATAYRIAQEVIRNCRQHAEAETITVDVSRSESDLVLHIVDDGRGFDPEAIGDRPGHLGSARHPRTRRGGRRQRHDRLRTRAGHDGRLPAAVVAGPGADRGGDGAAATR